MKSPEIQETANHLSLRRSANMIGAAALATLVTSCEATPKELTVQPCNEASVTVPEGETLQVLASPTSAKSIEIDIENADGVLTVNDEIVEGTYRIQGVEVDNEGNVNGNEIQVEVETPCINEPHNKSTRTPEPPRSTSGTSSEPSNSSDGLGEGTRGGGPQQGK